MQLRVAAAVTATKAGRLFSGEALKCKELRPFWLRTSTTDTSSIGRTADPSIHAEDPDEIEAEEAKKAASAEEEQKQRKKQQQRCLEEESKSSSVPSKPTPIASSPSIKSTEVSKPADPLAQQRRTYSQATTVVGEVTCVGFDGTPWPEDQQKGGRRSSEEEEEDNRVYFKDHKPSALSNIEMVDTRKPITKATDGTVTNSYYGYGGETMKFEVVMESAEETLMKAIRMWKENAMRGDPDLPHSRALRAALRARGEEINF